MKKWIVKKNVNSFIKKNMILEETQDIHLEAIPLCEYKGGFSLFSFGKNLKLTSGEVYKFIGKNKDFLEYFEEYKQPDAKAYYRWIGPLTGNLFPGEIYEESFLRNADQIVPLGTGIEKIYLF